MGLVAWEAELVPVDRNTVIYAVFIMVRLVGGELEVRVHDWP